MGRTEGRMRDIDQIKALLGVVVFELGLLIGICWAAVAR